MKKILVIRFRRVGDSVLSVAICSSLKKSFPDARIDYVLNDNMACLYENHPDIDRIITFTDEENHHFTKYIAKVWRLMRTEKYDAIIDTRSTLKTLFFSLFSLSTPYRIGVKKGYIFHIQNYLIEKYTKVTIDRVIHNMNFLKPLEQVGKITYCTDFRLYVDDADKTAFRTYMTQQGIDPHKPVVLATVTARLIHKVWDKERMKEILKRIIDQYDAQVIFNFSAGVEEEFALSIHHEMEDDPHIFTNIKAGSLKELAALTANCNFFFGNEGGPRHISQALLVPSYAIYPPNILKSVWLPNEGERYAGISPDDIAPTKQQESMDYLQRFNLITVDRVWQGLKPMLDRYIATR